MARSHDSAKKSHPPSPTYADSWTTHPSNDGVVSPLDQLIRPITPEYREFVEHLWRGGWYGVFWLGSRISLTADEARYLNETQNRKKKAKKDDSKVRLTTWVDLSLPLPAHLPPQDFRNPLYRLTPCDLERRLVRPDESGLSNLYHGVNPFFKPDARLLGVDKFGRRSIKFKDGTANESVAAVNCIFAEIDVKDFGGNWKAVDDYIKSLPIKPSVIIKSGGGYHLYWLFRDTYRLYDENFVRDPSQFKSIRGVQHGWVESFPRLDQFAKSIPGLLRPAGSLNVKEKYAPDYLSVDFVKRDMGLLYEIPQFEDVIKRATKLTIVVPTPKPASKSQTKPSQSASKPSPQPAANQPSWQPPTFKRRPTFRSQREKIEWHLLYYNHHYFPDWRRAAIYLSGEPDGLKIWVKWASQSPKFDEAENLAVWEEIQQGRREIEKAGKKPAGIGSLFEWAVEKKGAPGDPTREDEGEYQPVRKPNNSVYLVGLRGGVGEALASLIKPNSWALLNPEEADKFFSSPKRHQGKAQRKPKPLESWVMDHVHGGTRRLKIGGKSRKIKTCLVIAQTAMTRFWALRADDAKQAACAQAALADIGLTSVSYPVNVQFEHTSKKGSLNGPICIPYIYKADALSSIEDLEKMQIQSSNDPFSDVTSVRREQSYVVLVLFSEDVPASLLHNTHTTHPQLDPIGLLALPSVSPPYFALKTLKISLHSPTGQGEFLIKAGNVGFRAWDDLLKRDIFNDPTALTGLQAESIQQIQPVRTQAAEVGESVESVARWHNRRHVRLTSQACGCGQSLLTFDSGDGYEMGWCAACGGLPVTSFVQEAHSLGATLDELATQITLDNRLGQAGTYVIEHQPVDMAVDTAALVASHTDFLADLRKQLSDDIKRYVVDGAGKGRIMVVRATAGVGKSVAFRNSIPIWQDKHKLLTSVMTDTKRLSEEWCEGLPSSSFVFLGVKDCCTCYSDEFKTQAIAAGVTLRHRKECPYLAQVQDMMRKADRKQKATAIFRYEQQKTLLQGNKRLISGGGQVDVFVGDEDPLKAFLPSGRVDLRVINSTLSRMVEEGCDKVEMGILAALCHVCEGRQVKEYSDVSGDKILADMESYLVGQDLTLESCLKAIRNTRFAKTPELKPDEVDESIPLFKVWLPHLLRAVDKTMTVRAHPLFFLVQASKDWRYPKLEIEYWNKEEYLSECKPPEEYRKPLVPRHERHIFLDATANKLIYEALFPGWEVDIQHYTCSPSPQHRIIQIDGLNLTRKYLKDYLRVTMSKVAAILNDLDLILDGIITRKDIKEALARIFCIDDSMMLNFRNQRGANGLKDAEVVMLFADGTVPTSAALRLAHALWSHDSVPFETYDNGAHFAKSGARWVAKDARVQAVLDRVKAEGNQGSHRLRLVSPLGAKTLIIVSIYDATELIEGLNPERVERIDARRLHGNSKKVREALVTYDLRREERDKILRASNEPDTGTQAKGDTQPQTIDVSSDNLEIPATPLTREAKKAGYIELFDVNDGKPGEDVKPGPIEPTSDLLSDSIAQFVLKMTEDALARGDVESVKNSIKYLVEDPLNPNHAARYAKLADYLEELVKAHEIGNQKE